MTDAATMTAEEASFYVWSHHHLNGSVPHYSVAEGALRCAIAIKHGCVGLPKCNPNQCRCGAVALGTTAWDPWAWDVVEVRV